MSQGGQITGLAPVAAPLNLGAPVAVTGNPGASILPPPSGTANVNADDALVLLMKLSSETNSQQTETGRNSVNSAASRRADATAQRQKAINDAIEAQRKAEEEKSSGGFFDFITDNLGPVALVGMVIGSVYLVAADVAMHATGLDDGKMDLADAAGLGAMLAGPAGIAIYAAEQAIKKFGPEEIQQALDQGPSVSDDDVSKANKIAFAVLQAEAAIAVTVMTGGTCAPAMVAAVGIAISTTTQILAETGALKAVFGEKWAGYIAMGGAVAGAATCLVGGGMSLASSAQALSNMGKVAVAAQAGVAVAKGTHDVVQGVHNYNAAEYQHDADEHNIDAKRQKQMIDRINRMIDDIIGEMKDLKDSAQRTSSLVQGAIQTESQTLLMAGSMKV